MPGLGREMSASAPVARHDASDPTDRPGRNAAGGVGARASLGARAATGDEPRLRRWARRALTVPGYLLAALLAILLLPLALLPALALDAAGRHRAGSPHWPRARFVLGVTFLLLCEVAGLAGALLCWGLAGGPFGQGGERAHRLDHALQRWWAGTLFDGGRRLLGLGLRVAPERLLPGVLDPDLRAGDAEPPAPLLVLPRHASLVDTLLPIALLPRLRLRYVLKRELLWDPCLDIVGSRLPNAFVRRGVGDPAEIGRVAALAQGLGPGDAVVVFPEGTRFTAERRRRLLASASDELRADAAALEHTLPPRRGGVLALLDAAPEADVLILAHTGLEGAAHLGDLWHGALQGKTLEVELWRVPRARIPDDPRARELWLRDCWRQVDRWIGSRHRALDQEEAR